MSPRRNEGGEIVVPGRIGIGVGADVGARRACGIDLCYNFWHASPIILARDFDVPNLYWNVSFAANPQRFVNRLQNRIAFVAHVSRVDAAGLAGLASQRDQFFSFGVGRGRILERRGDADGAVFHGFAHQFLHLLQLSGTRLFVVVA